MVEEHIKKESFVTRIWLEHGDNGDPKWRGHIRHVQGEEEKYFQDLTEMREFLGRVSGVSGPALSEHPPTDEAKSKLRTSTDIKRKE